MTARGAEAAGNALFVGADGRARWFWRLLVFAAVTTAAALVLTAVVYPIAATVMSAVGVRLIAFSWISVGALLVAQSVSLRWVDGHRPLSFVCLGRESLAPRRIALGAVLGALAIGVPVSLLVASGWMREASSTAGSWWGAAWQWTLILLPAALSEELMLRGYPFAVLRERFGWGWAVAATSVVFGLLHVLNPGVTAEAIGMVVVAGVFLAAVLLVTESLYAAWAAHFAWNWTMAALLHAPVSGIPVATPGYRLVDAGPDWATGGAWGPEGGVGALLGMTAGLYFLWSRPTARARFGWRGGQSGAGSAGSGVASAASATSVATDTDARPASREER